MFFDYFRPTLFFFFSLLYNSDAMYLLSVTAALWELQGVKWRVEMNRGISEGGLVWQEPLLLARPFTCRAMCFAGSAVPEHGVTLASSKRRVDGSWSLAALGWKLRTPVSCIIHAQVVWLFLGVPPPVPLVLPSDSLSFRLSRCVLSLSVPPSVCWCLHAQLFCC